MVERSRDGIRETLNEISTITFKELVHCLRDSHVIIYSLILPLVFYPLIIIGASEFALWREGLTERSPILICIARDSIEQLPALARKIEGSKKVKAVRYPDRDSAIQALKDKKLDCFVEAKPDLSGMTTYFNPSADRHLEARVFVTTIASAAKSEATNRLIKNSGLPKDLLKVYSVSFKSLAEVKEIKTPARNQNKYAMIKSIAIGVFCIYTLVIIQSGTVYPALTAFTLEIEKKTILTTQLIPVHPWSLILGKFFSVLCVSITTALINLSSLLFVALYFLLKMPWSHEFLKRTVENTTLTDVAAVLWVFVLAIVLLSSTYCFIACLAKSFKEAQNISSLILIGTMLLPAVAMIPGVGLNSFTVLIPLSNLVLAAKGIVTDEVSLALTFVAVLLNLVLALVLLYLARLAFYGELSSLLPGKRAIRNLNGN